MEVPSIENLSLTFRRYTRETTVSTACLPFLQLAKRKSMHLAQAPEASMGEAALMEGAILGGWGRRARSENAHWGRALRTSNPPRGAGGKVTSQLSWETLVYTLYRDAAVQRGTGCSWGHHAWWGAGANWREPQNSRLRRSRCRRHHSPLYRRAWTK